MMVLHGLVKLVEPANQFLVLGIDLGNPVVIDSWSQEMAIAIVPQKGMSGLSRSGGVGFVPHVYDYHRFLRSQPDSGRVPARARGRRSGR